MLHLQSGLLHKYHSTYQQGQSSGPKLLLRDSSWGKCSFFYELLGPLAVLGAMTPSKCHIGLDLMGRVGQLWARLQSVRLPAWMLMSFYDSRLLERLCSFEGSFKVISFGQL